LKIEETKWAGILFSIGGLQWFFSIIISEGLHPGYNIPPNSQWIPYSSQIQFVSSLGVGSTAWLFNSSLLLFGLALIGGAYFYQKQGKSRLLGILLAIAGVGAMGVAAFPETIQPAHGIFQSLAFICGGLSAVVSFKVQKLPVSAFSLFLGCFSLVAIIVFFPYLGLGLHDASLFLGLGKGALERLVIYSMLMWEISFGYFLMTLKN